MAAAALDGSALTSPGAGAAGAWAAGAGAHLAAAMTAAGTRADGLRADGLPLSAAGAGAASGEKIGPGSTVAGFGGPGSAAPGFGGPGSAAAGFAGGMAGAPGTRPIPAGPIRPGDYADMLPPVTYGPARAAAGNGRQTGTLSPRDWPAGGPAVAAPGSAGARRRYPLLVIATMLIAASVSVILPVVGTLSALAALVLLRAGALAQRGVDQRRSDGGGPAANGLVAVAAFPWFLIRSVISTLLRAPFAIAVAVAAAVITILAVPVDPGPRAVAYAAGALVAFYGFGPGSGKARRQLDRIFAAIIGTRSTEAVAFIGLWALALAAVVLAASSSSAYWPLMAPTGFLAHLPGWHSITHVGHFRFWLPQLRHLRFW